MIEQDVNVEMNWAAHWSLVVNDIISNISRDHNPGSRPAQWLTRQVLESDRLGQL